MLVIPTIKLHFMIINATDVFIASVNSKYLLFAEYHDHLKADGPQKNVYLKSI